MEERLQFLTQFKIILSEKKLPVTIRRDSLDVLKKWGFSYNKCNVIRCFSLQEGKLSKPWKISKIFLDLIYKMLCKNKKPLNKMKF